MDEGRPADREMNHNVHKLNVFIKQGYIAAECAQHMYIIMPELLAFTPTSSCREKRNEMSWEALYVCLMCSRLVSYTALVIHSLPHLSSRHWVDGILYRRVALKGLNDIIRVLC